jgi:hypothetical protein
MKDKHIEEVRVNPHRNIQNKHRLPDGGRQIETALMMIGQALVSPRDVGRSADKMYPRTEAHAHKATKGAKLSLQSAHLENRGTPVTFLLYDCV